jgi:hypothetical protein
VRNLNLGPCVFSRDSEVHENDLLLGGSKLQAPNRATVTVATLLLEVSETLARSLARSQARALNPLKKFLMRTNNLSVRLGRLGSNTGRLGGVLRHRVCMA